MSIDVDAFIDGYIECALWADCMPPESEPDGEFGGCEDLELRPGCRAKMAVDCIAFCEHEQADLTAYCEQIGGALGYIERNAIGRAKMAGHDFWLTRCGHGAGFWDRGLGKLGDRLTNAAKAYGSPDDHHPYDCGDGTADC